MQLSNLAYGRDNNFNLIRIIAALAVLVSHSFTLALGPGNHEPVFQVLGMTLGTIAVDVFFITSGFLVTASLSVRQNAVDFIWARSLRIFPGLIVMTLFTVFLVGPAFTELPLRYYFLESQTYLYLVKCATLIAGVEYQLPAVFENNPLRIDVNAALWTLPREIAMYSVLALVWIIFRRKYAPFKYMVIAIAGVSGATTAICHFSPLIEDQWARLFFMFFSGASYYVLKEYITISRLAFWLSALAILCSAVIDQHVFFLVYLVGGAYVLLYSAYVPSGRVRNYNRFGDYSYGVYIYAFPIQQSVVALIPGISVVVLLLFSAATTISLGAVSWYLIERRALMWKTHRGQVSNLPKADLKSLN
jgi:peptidoglycan/LPS O-acetylase OafA/YrhL